MYLVHVQISICLLSAIIHKLVSEITKIAQASGPKFPSVPIAASNLEKDFVTSMTLIGTRNFYSLLLNVFWS